MSDIDTSSEGENPSSVVMDPGSCYLKAGFSGEDCPSVFFPSMLGSRRKDLPGLMRSQSKDAYVGCKAQEKRDFLSMRNPIQRGLVTNWEDMETLLHHAYSELNTRPEEQALLMSQPPLQPISHKEYLAQLMFEAFDCPSLCLKDSSHLCLYSCGRASAVVVDIGDGVSFAVPFYESYCAHNGIQRQEFAGQDVTHYLQKLLQGKGNSFATLSEIDSVREMKESVCYTSLDFESEFSRVEPSTYGLHDGTDVVLRDERFVCPEILFNPSMFGFKGVLGIQHMVYQALQACEIDTRPDIACNIMLSGGCALIPGFRERLKKELAELLPKSLRINVVAYNDKDSIISNWIGGSILASLSFWDEKVSKKTYEEYGPSVFHNFLKSAVAYSE